MSRCLLVSAAALILAATASAQTQVPVHKAVTPKHAGVFKMATGELVPADVGVRSGPDVIFNASELTNYYSVPGIDQEWLDEGTLLDRGLIANADQMNGFEFVYCSTEADATQNSGTVTFAFYDDTVICSGPSNGGNFALGGYMCAYDIVGLPLGDANGAIQCWIVTVDLMFGFECPPAIQPQPCGFDWPTDSANGKLFGWSFIPRNDNTGPWLSKGGTQAAGIDNSFVWFDQFGALVGCFWFGGTPFANFAMKMFGNEANCRALNDCTQVNTVQLGVTVLGPNIRQFTIVNPTPGDTYWIGASFGVNELPLPNGTTLILALPLIPPTPAPMPNNTITTPPLPSGTIYFQAFCTSNGLPPSPGNLPSGISNAWCEVIP
ncbi:MAG: hypothetical protein DWQ01_06860 [Planctomycetota bacterium]|nr:MAG: hypothetical protein DWQ01_06860 [Planctomycetota bacterium]